jgi:CRISPR/Cas system-associated exonuclease Cas4 (RecB family)
MAIDSSFRFSANNLQEYVSCPRRFELRYLLKQPYPAVISQPELEMEQRIELGKHFHTIVNQYLSGVPKGRIVDSIRDDLLEGWFDNFLSYIEPYQKEDYLTEHTLMMPFEGFQMTSRFDLIIKTGSGKILILDWKSTEKEPALKYYKNRIQTILYLYLAVECAPFSNQANSINPDDVTMQYWFPQFPHKNILFPYSQSNHKQNRDTLKGLILEINATSMGDFKKTENQNRCKYCQYRTLCKRGNQAGDYQLIDDEVDLDDLIENITLESLDEIQY